MVNFDSVAPRLYGYATYPTMNNASYVENHIEEMPQTMQMTLYFAICEKPALFFGDDSPKFQNHPIAAEIVLDLG